MGAGRLCRREVSALWLGWWVAGRLGRRVGPSVAGGAGAIGRCRIGRRWAPAGAFPTDGKHVTERAQHSLGLRGGGEERGHLRVGQQMAQLATIARRLGR